MPPAAVPGQGHATAVASNLLALAVNPEGVLALFLWHHHLLQPELLALIEEDLARQAQEKEQSRASAGAPDNAAAQPRHVPDHVVVGLGPAGGRNPPG